MARWFFFRKAVDLIAWHQRSIPRYSPEPEEIEAGFERLQATFGIYATIAEISKKINIPEATLYKDWSAQEFWYKHLYEAHSSAIQGKYRELIMKRK